MFVFGFAFEVFFFPAAPFPLGLFLRGAFVDFFLLLLVCAFVVDDGFFCFLEAGFLLEVFPFFIGLFPAAALPPLFTTRRRRQPQAGQKSLKLQYNNVLRHFVKKNLRRKTDTAAFTRSSPAPLLFCSPFFSSPFRQQQMTVFEGNTVTLDCNGSRRIILILLDFSVVYRNPFRNLLQKQRTIIFNRLIDA